MRRTLVILLCLALSCAALAEGDSLWGMQVRAELVEPPAEAFDPALEQPRVAGISADGEKLLIVGVGGAPYLWDRGSGERLYLAPGNDAMEEQLEMNWLGVIGKQPEEKREAFRERLEKMYAKAPGDARLARLSDPGLRISSMMYPQGAQGDYMMLFNEKMSIFGLLDCRDGKWYCPEQGMPSLPVIDGRCVVFFRPEAMLWDVESGETSPIDFGMPGWTLVYAAGLPDGSVCGALQDRSEIDKKNGQPTALAILTPDGSREEYALGKQKFGQAIGIFMTGGDGSRVVAFSQMTLERNRPFLIDRAAGTVSLLTHSEDGMRAIPLADCLDENGIPVLSDEDAAGVWIPLAGMRDGRLLAIDMSRNELLLIDLGTLETDVLLDDAGLSELDDTRMNLLAAPLPLTGNGLDTFALRSLDKYLHLVSEG